MNYLETNAIKSKLLCYNAPSIAPVAQLDRVLVSEAKGRGFDSRRARQLSIVSNSDLPTKLQKAMSGK